jgi:hypothetical protein
MLAHTFWESDILASNDKTVMSQFSKEDLGKDLKDLDIGDDSLPLSFVNN